MGVISRVFGVLFFFGIFYCGCALLKTEERKALENVTLEQVGIIRGTVTGGSSPDKPIVVALLAADLNVDGYIKQVVDKRVLYRSGRFHFMVPPGTYFVGAFEDGITGSRYLMWVFVRKTTSFPMPAPQRFSWLT